MRNIKFRLKGMHCVSCAMNIDFGVEDIDGVFRVSTSYAKQETQVEFDEKKTDEQKIKEVIEKLGYEIEQQKQLP